MATREPIGVGGAVIPWNAPLLLMALKIAPTLVAGNGVVVKSAEESPLAVLRVCEIMNQILPAGLFNILSGFGPERSEEHTSELQSLMRISYAVFCLKKKTTTHIK